MDDLISRQAILDMLEDINNHIIDGCGYKHDWCVGWVKGLPTKDAVKHGVWEIYVISMFDGEGCRCSECGFEGVPYWDFCPNCGARMDGVENG